MAVAAKKTASMTAEDFFSEDAPDKFVELVEGELSPMSPLGWRHNDVAYKIGRAHV